VPASSKPQGRSSGAATEPSSATPDFDRIILNEIVFKTDPLNSEPTADRETRENTIEVGSIDLSDVEKGMSPVRADSQM